MSRNHFTASCLFSLFYFHQNHFKKKNRHTSYLRLVSVMMLQQSASVNACTRSVHICSQSCSSSDPRPLSVKYRPISSQFRCPACLCICAVVYNPNMGVSFQGFDLAGRQWTLVPPIGSHVALTLNVFGDIKLVAVHFKTAFIQGDTIVYLPT